MLEDGDTTTLTKVEEGVYYEELEQKLTNNIISSHFKRTSMNVATQDDSLVGKVIALPTASPPYISFKVPYTKVDDWKGYLSAQNSLGTPVTVDYELIEPIYEDVDLPEIPTYSGTSNIIVTDGNLNSSKIEMTVVKK